MKIQLFFIKGISIICLSFFLLFSNSSSDIYAQTANIQEPLKNVLTLELSFGDEKTIKKDDFLLVRPRIITVNKSGDILVCDEYRIKVYNDKGKEKTIIGKPGIIRSGDFEDRPAFYLGPEEYLIVVDPSNFASSSEGFITKSRLGNYYYLFAPDYKFIEKKRFENSLRIEDYLKTKELNIKYIHHIAKIIVINTDEKVYEIALTNKEPITLNTLEDVRGAAAMRNQPTKPDTNYSVILYENADIVVPLLQTRLIKPLTMGHSPPFPLGELHWELLTDRRVICGCKRRHIQRKNRIILYDTSNFTGWV